MVGVRNESAESLSRLWLKVAATSKVVAGTRMATATNPSSPLCIETTSFNSIPIPNFLLKNGSAVRSDVTVSVFVSLFDGRTVQKTAAGEFFGNTWRSKPVPLASAIESQESSTSEKWQGRPATSCKLSLPTCIVVHTSCLDPAVKVVFELTAAETQNGIVVKEYALGWAFAQLYTAGIVDRKGASSRVGGDKLLTPLHFGTPRLLLFLQGPDAANPGQNPALEKARIKSGTCGYSISLHSEMKDFLHFVPEHQLVGVSDLVPGLKASRDGTTLLHPDPLPVVPMFLGKVQVKIDNVTATRAQSFLSSAATTSPAFILRCGIHNGRTYLGHVQDLPLVAANNNNNSNNNRGGRGNADSETLYVSNEEVDIGDYPIDTRCTIAALLVARVKTRSGEDEAVLAWGTVGGSTSTREVVVGSYWITLKTGKIPTSVSNLKLVEAVPTPPKMKIEVICDDDQTKVVDITALDPSSAIEPGTQQQQQQPAPPPPQQQRRQEQPVAPRRDADFQAPPSPAPVAPPPRAEPARAQAPPPPPPQQQQQALRQSGRREKPIAAGPAPAAAPLPFVPGPGARIEPTNPQDEIVIMSCMMANVPAFSVSLPESTTWDDIQSLLLRQLPPNVARPGDELAWEYQTVNKSYTMVYGEHQLDAFFDRAFEPDYDGKIPIGLFFFDEDEVQHAAASAVQSAARRGFLQRHFRVQLQRIRQQQQRQKQREDERRLPARSGGPALPTFDDAIAPPSPQLQQQQQQRRSTRGSTGGARPVSGGVPRYLEQDELEPPPPAPAPPATRPISAGAKLLDQPDSQLQPLMGNRAGAVSRQDQQLQIGVGHSVLRDEGTDWRNDLAIAEDVHVAHCVVLTEEMIMSRALKARLFSSHIAELLPDYTAVVPSATFDSTSDVPNFGLEAADEYQANEIVIQLLAAKLPPTTSNIYVTINFYHFPPVRTANLVLVTGSGSGPGADPKNEAAAAAEVSVAASQEAHDNIRYLVTADAPSNASASAVLARAPRGITIRILVDPATTGKENSEEFCRYLASRPVEIQVWDSDSLLSLGVVRANLRCLLRQRRPAVQFAAGFEIVELSEDLGVDPTDRKSVSAARPGHFTASTRGQLFLRTACVGRVSKVSSSNNADNAITVRKSAVSTTSSKLGAVVSTSNNNFIADPSGLISTSTKTTANASTSASIVRVLPLTDIANISSSIDPSKLNLGGALPSGDATLQHLFLHRRTINQLLTRSAGGSGSSIAVPLPEAEVRKILSEGCGMSQRLIAEVLRVLNVEAMTSDGRLDFAAFVTRLRLDGTKVATGGNLTDADIETLLEKTLRHDAGSVEAVFRNYSGGGDKMTPLMFAKMLQDLRVTLDGSLSNEFLRAVGAIGGNDRSISEGCSLSNFTAFLRVSLVAKDGGRVGGAGRGGAADDAERRRKQRWQNLQQHRERKLHGGNSVGLGVDPTLEAVKVEQLKAVQALRANNREEKIKQFLKGSITTRKVIYPSFGELCFFTFKLRNPFSRETAVWIRFSDEELQLVTDVDEWKAFAALFGDGGTPEPDLIAFEGGIPQIFLNAGDEVHIPFKLRSFASGCPASVANAVRGPVQVMEPSGTEAGVARIVNVGFFSRQSSNDAPLCMLEVDIRPQPFVVDQTFRFFQAQNDFVKKRILVDTTAPAGGAGAGGALSRLSTAAKHGWVPVSEGGVTTRHKYVWCDQDDVVVGSAAHTNDPTIQQIYLRYRCGPAPSVTTFYLCLYNDIFQASLYERWKVEVHSLRCADIAGVVGQRSEGQLCMRGGQQPANVKAYSSHPTELTIAVPSPIILPAQALTEVPFTLRPRTAGRRNMIVHLIDSSTRSLHSAWLIATNISAPIISRSYEMRLRLGYGENKKILYVNPYQYARTFFLRTNYPELLSFKQDKLAIGAKGQQYIGMQFIPRETAGSVDIMIFINDEEDKSEDCLAITVTYA